MPDPTTITADARALLNSAFTLSRLLLTSTAFHDVASDVLTFLRERLGDTVASVGHTALEVGGVAEVIEDVAKKVERVAGAVEDVAEDVVNIAEDTEAEVRKAGTGPEDLPGKAQNVDQAFEGAQEKAGDVREKAEDEARRTQGELVEDAQRLGEDFGRIKANVELETKERWEDIKQEAPDRMREVVVQRMQEVSYLLCSYIPYLLTVPILEVIIQAHRKSEYRVAMQTILNVLSEYAQRVSVVSSVVTDVHGKGRFSPSTQSEDPFSDPPTTSSAPQPEPPTSLPSSSALPVSVTPVVWTDPHLDAALFDLKSFVERFTSGRPLDTLLTLVQRLARDIATAPVELIQVDDHGNPLSQARHWFGDAQQYLAAALKDPQYATSRTGARTAGHLYDRAAGILSRSWHGDTQFGHDLRAAWTELDALATAISSDAAILRLARALGSLSVHLAVFSPAAEVTTASRRIRRQLQHDLISWVLPRVLRLCSALPMPRVEFTSPSLDAAIDAVMITAHSFGASLVPDRVRVENWSEVDLDMAGTESNTTTKSRTRVHVDGIRLSAKDIGYYARYKGPAFVGYEDEGLISVDIGGSSPDAVGEGLRATVDLEMNTDWEAWSPDAPAEFSEDDAPLFHVNAVKVDIPGMRFSIDRSKHWIINKAVLQPLAGPTARFAVGWVAQSQIKSALEAMARAAGIVRKDAIKCATQRGEPELIDYWQALVAFYKRTSSSDGDEEQEDAGNTESHIMPTVKGVIYTTKTQPQPDSPSLHPPEPTETTIAVGLGAQVLPGKGGPHDQDSNDTDPESSRCALDEIEDGITTQVQTTRDAALNTRHDLDNAQVRTQVRIRLEQKKSGWRSEAFDT
jgi:uncharacterized protein YoxC